MKIEIKNGKTEFDFNILLENKKDGIYEIKIKKASGKISLSFNNYYHAVIGIIANYTGNDLESEKMILKNMFYPKVEKFGRLEPVSTTELSSAELTEIMYEIKKWAYNYLNIILPEPEKWETIELRK